MSRIKALEVLIKIHDEAIKKLNKVIAQKNFDGENTKKDINMKDESSRKLTHLRNLLAEESAALEVVSAPTEAEITKASEYIDTIRNIAIADAATSAGLKIIKDALEEASRLQDKVA